MVVLVINMGAGGVATGEPSRTSAQGAKPACPHARKAVKFYAASLNRYEQLMNRHLTVPEVRHNACQKWLAHVLQRKAHAARRAYYAWREYHWYWWKWLPDKWARIGACETGFGRKPGNFQWDSGTYVSAFGIYRAGYSQYAHEIGQLSWDETRSRLKRYPTPREQYNVALRIYYHYGFSGWGCRNA